MSIPTFQKLMDEEKEETKVLGPNMQVKASSGGKRRRTRTKKRRVKKIKRKTRTRKYKRRSTKKRRGTKSRRKTKNRRRRGGAKGETFDARRDRLIAGINDTRIKQGLKAVPEEHIHDHIDKMVKGRKNIHEHVIKDALKAADRDGNTKTTLTGLVSSITPRQLDITGHKDRVALRKEVQRVKENNPNLTNIAAAGDKVAEERGKRDVFNNMEKHVRGAVQLHDNIKQVEVMTQDAENQRKANIGELEPQVRPPDSSLFADAVLPEDRGNKSYGKYGGRRRSVNTSRTRRKKRSGRRNRSRKV